MAGALKRSWGISPSDELVDGGWISAITYDTASDTIFVTVKTDWSLGPLPIEQTGSAEIGVRHCSLAGPHDLRPGLSIRVRRGQVGRACPVA